MAKKSIYEDVLSKYTEYRTDYLTKERDYTLGIEKTREQIKANAEKMAEAIATGKQEEYTRLHTENIGLEATVTYYEESLKRLHNDAGIDKNEIDEMIKSIESEAAKLNAEFKEEIVKRLTPVIQYAEEMRDKRNLYNTARNKISLNLAHGRYGQTNFTFDTAGLPDLSKYANGLHEVHVILGNIASRITVNDISQADAEMKQRYASELKKWN